MESFSYPQFPTEISAVYITLLEDVQNAAKLRARLVAAASLPGQEGRAEREAVNFAFIDARLARGLLFLSHNTELVLIHSADM